MTTYAQFMLSSSSSVTLYQTIEISHTAFSKVYRIVRNNPLGISVTLETGNKARFDYVPMEIRHGGARGDLDYSIQVQFGDLGTDIPKEIDLMRAADGMNERPTLRYREYTSDDLLAPIRGPIDLELATIDINHEGASFEATARHLNISATGELYRLSRFPMRGFV